MRQVGGWKFRRQHPIGPYFVDFYCPAARLVVLIVPVMPEASPVGAADRLRTVALTADGHRTLALGAPAPRRSRRGDFQGPHFTGPYPSRPLGKPHEYQGDGRRD
jgi:Protein of unknown function (DUF559)